MHAAAYFKGNKHRCNVLTDMLCSICGLALWIPDIDLCNRYIVHRISFNITNTLQQKNLKELKCGLKSWVWSHVARKNRPIKRRNNLNKQTPVSL